MLSQGELLDYSAVDPTTGENVYAEIAPDVSGFLSNYRTWMDAGGPADLDRIGADLASARGVLTQRQNEAATAGDQASLDAAGEAIGEIDTLDAARAAIADRVNTWQSTWDTMSSWLTSIGGAFGLGLPLIPLGLTAVVAVAAIAALAWTVTNWQDVRARTATIADLADRMARGELSAQQVKTLTDAASSSGGGSLFAGLGMAGLLAAGVVAVLVFRR